jgi:hypothetical protein
MIEPASIRYNNPGAMWGGNKIAQKWHATGNIALNDGLNQNNHAAVFPTKVDGACAQFDLWKSKYAGLSLASAIKVWSGGNSSPQYVDFLCKKSGIDAQDVVNLSVLSGPKGLALIKAQAQWEAGKPYPLSDEDWEHAQALVFGRTLPQAPPPVPPAPDKPIETSEPANPPSVWAAIFASILKLFKGK